MKVMSPAVTVLLTSHMKPYLDEALASLVAQTRKDFHVLVLDSGQWIGGEDDLSCEMAAVYARWSRHPLVEWVTTGEAPGLLHRACPVGWVTNEAIRAGLVRGRYMCTFYDDDRYRPRFIEVMAGFLDGNPAAGAVWCSQACYRIERDGTVQETSPRHATEPRGAGGFDCLVDGGQVMWRTSLLDEIGDPWLPEDAEHSVCCHSDGIFLEKVARAAGTVHPVAEILCENRKTPLSRYAPT